MAHQHQGARFIIKPWGKYYICDVCGQEFQSLRRKIINAVFWKWRFYCARGEGFIADVNGLWSILGGGTIGIVAYRASEGHLNQLWIIPAIWIGQKIVVFYLGYMDYNHWHIVQNEAMTVAQFNPPLIEQLRILNELRDKIIPDKKQPSILDNYKK